jgi:hypothetical protein
VADDAVLEIGAVAYASAGEEDTPLYRGVGRIQQSVPTVTSPESETPRPITASRPTTMYPSSFADG